MAGLILKSQSMYRISATTLESFRRFMEGTTSYDTEENLINTLMGLFKGNDKTKTGSAYHKILEGDYMVHDNIVSVTAEKMLWAFTMEQALPGINYHSSHPLMTHEVPVDKVYHTPQFGPIQVTGRIDGLEGTKAHDGKTKYSTVEPQNYIDSAQWKIYLDILDLDEFQYDVFEVKGFKSLSIQSPVMLPGVSFIAHDPIPCLRYDGMHDEIVTLISDFLSYIDNRQLWPLLKPALNQPELDF